MNDECLLEDTDFVKASAYNKINELRVQEAL